MRFIHTLIVCLITLLTPGMAIAASPVAYVYVQEDSSQSGDTAPSPISVYADASDGKLTKIKGSPFKQIAGVMVGNNGKHIVTLDAGYLHSYAVSSEGVIGAQVSEINTQLYTGAGCAGVSPFQWAQSSFAKMDHAGEYVYKITNGTKLYGNPVALCSAVETFKVGSSGLITFQNNLLNFNDQAILGLTETGNSKFALIDSENNHGDLSIATYERASDGDLMAVPNPTINYPKPEPGSDSHYTWVLWQSPDPTDHLAVIVEDIFGCGTDQGCVAGSYALASFTMTSRGDLVSTNTWANMPLAQACCFNSLMLNPAGTILAVSTGSDIEFYKFDGAGPMTAIGSPIVGNSGALSIMAWDKDNHLFALNAHSGKLHVYTVTDKGGGQVSGSPYTVPFCGYLRTPIDSAACTQTLVVRSAQ
jgi:hypothetical protein